LQSPQTAALSEPEALVNAAKFAAGPILNAGRLDISSMVPVTI
jgi:hypothetical protein